MGDIVWARRDHDGVYWPGKINFISKNLSETGLTHDHVRHYQTCSYLILFFGCNQTHWTVDILPYRQYRDYISKNLVVYYEHYPQIKYQLLDAMSQADNESSISNSSPSFGNNPHEHYHSTMNSIVTNKDLTSRNSTALTTNEYPFNHYFESSNIHPQYVSNSCYNTQLSVNNYCSCCVQPSFSSTENNSNSLLQFNDDYHQNDTNNSQIENAIIIVTTKTYSNSSFISYLFNCFSHFIHHSIIYIDDSVNNNQHPITPNISYLICLDNFDSDIKQILNSTILNNLTANINYLFLVLNAPSYELVKYFYSTVMDQRTIVVLHYRSTFDSEPMLLCSGNRTTYETIRPTLLKYLCSKVKYIESDGEEQFNSTNHIKDEPITDIPNQPLILKHSKKVDRHKLMKTLDKRLAKRKLKTHVPKNGILSVSRSECHVQNILETYSSSK